MVTPIVFVDVDGVLNTMDDYINAKATGQVAEPVNEALVATLVDWVQAIKGQIVISSSWRKWFPERAEYSRLFGDAFANLMHEDWRTGSDKRGHRGNEVLDWLSKNGWPPHVIFDDDTDFYEFQPFHHVDPVKGLQQDDCHAAYQFLLDQEQYPILSVGGIGYKQINLLDVRTEYIAHGCNAQGVMGKGVAKAIRDKWPGCYEAYNLHYRMHGLKVGEVVWYDKPGALIILDPYKYDREHVIANIITQDYYGKLGPDKVYVDYEGLRIGFQQVAQVVKTAHRREVAIPMIGAGLGGGDWNKISAIIQQIGEAEDIRFTVCVLDQTHYEAVVPKLSGAAPVMIPSLFTSLPFND